MSGDHWYDSRPRSERKVNRIKDVYFFIKKHGPIKRSTLLEEFGTTVRTLERDLDVLNHNDLIYSPKRGWWAVTERKVKGDTNA